MELTWSITSASSSKRSTVMTGPNTSSFAMRISCVTSARMVGSKNWPPSSGAARPPVSSRAPRATASSTSSCTRPTCAGIVMAPWSSSAPPLCSGAPCLNVATIASARSRKASYRPSCTYTRSTPMQFCPQFWNVPRSTDASTASRSTSSKMTAGSLPPSSRITGVRFADAPRMTSLPTAGEPVKMILSTSDSTSATPASPKPVTSCTRSGEWPHDSSTARAMRMYRPPDHDEYSDGFDTTALPANSPETMWLYRLWKG
mmetsp:Transcript_12439/g.43539  ORF Transcript_12439/g.43539 Transcript_12439/m.43539 type:complete len:259 (+) Transcript_12439:310-1086(+)